MKENVPNLLHCLADFPMPVKSEPELLGQIESVLKVWSKYSFNINAVEHLSLKEERSCGLPVFRYDVSHVLKMLELTLSIMVPMILLDSSHAREGRQTYLDFCPGT